MQQIEIENFKGFHKPAVVIKTGGDNLLLFGENGAGKSSLYEALRHFFFAAKIEAELVPASAIGEDREQILNDYYAKLHYAGEPNPAVIKVDNKEVSVFKKQEYQMFMISPSDLQARDKIQLEALCKNWYFDGNIASVLATFWDDLQKEVNKTLTEEFRESINIRIDRSGSGSAIAYYIIVTDTRNERSHRNGLNIHFNESRLHLVQLLLMLEIAHLLYDNEKKNILVLDDFVTSLDAANRAFIVRYLLRAFKQFQLVVMTHNAGFYNLFRYEANLMDKNRWHYGCLYCSDKTCKYYEDKKSENLLVDVSAVSDADPEAMKDVGNKLRRNFEILVHRIARHLSVGGIEESHILLSQLDNSPIIYRNAEQGADSILNEI